MTKLNLEKIILLVFFSVMLLIGPGVLFDHKIKHDFPFGYGASDAFQHQTRAESIKDMGNFKYEAAYISKGFENAIGRYPPALYHIAVILSYASGLEVYDSIYFLVIFFAIIASTIMFFVIKNFNKSVALLSLPLSLLIFTYPVSMGLYWGHWPSLLAQSFMVLLFWAVMRINLSYSWALIGISLSAIALTHTSENVFAVLFIGILFLIKLIARKLEWKETKDMIYAVILFLAASFYYLVIFNNTWAKGDSYSFFVKPIWEGNPGFYISMFGLLLIPLALGFIVSLLKLKECNTALIVALSMLLAGFLNYAGFDTRSFQIRFFWPIYLSVFLGLGLYMACKFVIKKRNALCTLIVLSIVSLLILGILPDKINFKDSMTSIDPKNTLISAVLSTFPQYNANTNQGIANQYHWQVFQWVDENTPPDATIYFFYGDIYGQDAILRNTKRIHFQVDPNDFIKSIQERKIKQEYVTEFPGDTGGGIAYRKSFFEFVGFSEPQEFHLGPRDICTFDYYVFDKVSRQQALAQYNLLIANRLVKKDFIEPVFENDVAIILKNNNAGDDCIEEGSF
jgi:hypothetical protein